MEKGVAPCGLGARDTLRLEAAMHLYGSEMNDTISPIEASLKWIVNFDHEYIGRDVLKKQVEEGVSKKLVAIKLSKRNIARHDYPVFMMEKKLEKSQVELGLRLSVNQSLLLMFLQNILRLELN